MNDPVAASLETVLRKALGQKALPATIDDDTALLGGVPDFDSLAILAILTGIHETLGCQIGETEVSADIFESVGALRRFVQARLDDQG